MGSLISGFLACMSGASASSKNPAIRTAYWKLVIAVILLSAVIGTGGLWLVDYWLPSSPPDEAVAAASFFSVDKLSYWAESIARILVIVIVALAAPILAFFLVNLIFPLFNDAILMAALKEESPQRAAELEASKGPSWSGSMVNTLRRLANLGFWSVLVLLLGFIPVVGTIIVTPLQLAVTSYFLTWELLEPYFGRRDMSWKEQKLFMRHHRMAMLGFGVPASTIFAIPILGPLFFGFAQGAGAHLIVRVLEKKKS